MHGCSTLDRAAPGRVRRSASPRPGVGMALVLGSGLGLAAVAAATAARAPLAAGPVPTIPAMASFEKLEFQGSGDLGPPASVEERVFPDGTRVRLSARSGDGIPSGHAILVTLPDGTRLGPAALPPVNVLWHPDVWRGDVDGDGEDEFLYDCAGVPNGSHLHDDPVPQVTVLDPRGSGPDRSLLVIDHRVAELTEVVTAMRARLATARRRDPADDLAAPFAAAGVRGSAIILPASADADLGAWEHDPAANDRRSSPASTSKIPHALFALRSGAIADLGERFEWDGRTRSVPAWNRDLTVAEAIDVSAAWVFRAISERIGAAEYQAAFSAYGAGSARTHGDGPFWLDGTLTISPREQVVMLRRLHGRDPWVGVDHRRHDVLRHVASALPAVTGDGWTLRYKTGWARDGPVEQGWCIGWVEREGAEPVYVATRIDLPDAADAARRLPLTLACLRAAGVIPAG